MAQQSTLEQKGSTEDRVLTGATGAANLFIGTYKGVGALLELGATPATLGASTVLGLYEATQTAGQGAAGVTQIIGSITGKTTSANEKADNIIIHSSIVGFATLKFSHGNKELAVNAAAAEAIVSTSATRAIFRSAASMLDTFMNVIQLSKPSKP